jgi:S-ribosylhomocysteine lyase LuxS involved in autoinducer biosynthesis
MQGPTDEASIPTNYVMNGRVMGGTLRRKVATRTKPWLLRVAAVETPALPPHPPPPPEDEDLPAAKKSRLHAPTSISTTAVGITTASSDDTPTDSVTLAASVPSVAASRAPPRSWTPAEDAKLTEAVRKYGKHCWVAVATLVPVRTPNQCLQRWNHTLDPANVKNAMGKWTPEEDAKLTEAVKKHGKRWVAVAVLVPGRTNVLCRARWINTVDPANVKNAAGKWTPEEDAKLTEAVQKHGKNWVTAAALVHGRTHKQCRQRWVDTLDPANAKKARWSPEDDAKLTEAVQKHGKHWVTVAALVPGRTHKQCHQRWVHNLDAANGVKGKWTPEEDSNLIEAVKKHDKDWVSVAAMVPGRTDKQCRRRWVDTLDPGKNTGKWTSEEDAKLTEATKKHGKNWVTVAAMVPGRRDNQCRRRWLDALNHVNKKNLGK